MPTDRQHAPRPGALRDRVADRRERPPAEGPRHDPLPGQMTLSFSPEAAPPTEPAEAAIPAAALGDRRLADVDFVVLAALVLAAGDGPATDTSDEAISERTSGRPQPKGVARALERLEGCGYVRVEATPDGRKVALLWRLGQGGGV